MHVLLPPFKFFLSWSLILCSEGISYSSVSLLWCRMLRAWKQQIGRGNNSKQHVCVSVAQRQSAGDSGFHFFLSFGGNSARLAKESQTNTSLSPICQWASVFNQFPVKKPISSAVGGDSLHLNSLLTFVFLWQKQRFASHYFHISLQTKERNLLVG